MKKAATILSLVMMVGLTAACGNKADNSNAASTVSPKASEAATAAATTAATAAASSTPAAVTGKIADIKKAGKIILGTSADYAPYEFHKNIDGKDTIVGFDIEIAKAVAKDLGVELEIKDLGFDTLLPALATDKVDFVMAGMTPDEKRALSVDFSKIYYNAEQGILVRAKDNDKYKSMDDLKKATIGVQTGSTQEKIAQEQLTGAKIKSLGKITDLVLNLKNNKVDAVIMELPVANGYVKNNADLVISSIKPANADGGSAVAIKKGTTELVNQINTSLDKLNADKSIEKFVNDAFLLNEK